MTNYFIPCGDFLKFLNKTAQIMMRRRMNSNPENTPVTMMIVGYVLSLSILKEK